MISLKIRYFLAGGLTSTALLAFALEEPEIWFGMSLTTMGFLIFFGKGA